MPYRTLMNWIEGGVFRPRGYAGKRGVACAFDKKDIRELFTYKVLRDFFSAHELGQMMSKLRALGHNPLSQGEFIVVCDSKGRGIEVHKVHGDEILSFSKNRNVQQLRLFPVDRAALQLESVLGEGPDSKPVVSLAGGRRGRERRAV